MPVRSLVPCLAAALLAALPVSACPADMPKPHVRAKPVQRVYEVADLVLPLDQEVGLILLGGTKDGDKGKPADAKATLEDQLITLITQSVRPTSWSGMGGPGTVDYFPLTHSLIINQTPAVHEQIEALLTNLRKLQDVEVAVEVRFVTVPDNSFERIGVDFNIDVKPGQEADSPIRVLPSPPSSALVEQAFLDDMRVFQLLESVQGDARSSVMQAPKMTVANGQRASLRLTDKHYYVTGVDVARSGNQLTYVPRNEEITTGLALSVRPVVAADQRSVLLNLQMEQTQLASGQVPLFPVVSLVTPEGDRQARPVAFTQYVQQPQRTTVAIDKTLKIPDGVTVVLGGWKRPCLVCTETSVPVLSKVPYVNRLFKNVGYGREDQTVLVLVTPRILVNGKEKKEPKQQPAAWSQPPREPAKEQPKPETPQDQGDAGSTSGFLDRAAVWAVAALDVAEELVDACREGRISIPFLVCDYSSDPNRRMMELLNNSEDLKQIEFEWERLWFGDEPSHLMPERVGGGLHLLGIEYEWLGIWFPDGPSSAGKGGSPDANKRVNQLLQDEFTSGPITPEPPKQKKDDKATHLTPERVHGGIQ